MRTTTFTLTALLAALAQAIEITSPAKASSPTSKPQPVDFASGYTVQWTTVASDPPSAHLFLVNMAGGHSPFSMDLGEVDLSKGSYFIPASALSKIPTDEGYQFNLQSVTKQNTGILAQSGQFVVVEDSADVDEARKTVVTGIKTTATPATLPTASGTAAAAASTLVTETVSGTATASGSASTTGSTSASASTSAKPAEGAAAGLGVKKGSWLALVAGLVAVMA